MGHRAATMSLFHRVLSFAIACASPHDKPISLSSVSTVFLQVVLSLPLFLLPAGVHLRATLGILCVDIRKTCPSHLSRVFESTKCTPGFVEPRLDILLFCSALFSRIPYAEPHLYNEGAFFCSRDLLLGSFRCYILILSGP